MSDTTSVHVIADTRAKLSAASSLLNARFPVTSELIGAACVRGNIDAVVVAADLRIVENITALKALTDKLKHIPKRIFLIDQRTRLAVMQAYALGATDALVNSGQSKAIAGETGR